MKFESAVDSGLDRERLRRMATGWAVGAGAIVVLLVVAALNPAQALEDIPDDKVLEVALAKTAEAPKPEPKIEVRPAPSAVVRRSTGPGGGLSTPNKIPDGTPDESDLSADSNPYGDGFDLAAYGSGSGRGGGHAATAVVQVVEKKAINFAPAPPKHVSLETNPAVELSRGAMVYPASAKAAKVQGTVAVRFVVGASGEPEQIHAVSGPQVLHEACEARVRGTRYQPATDKSTGQVVPITKILRCVFRLT